MPKVKFELPSQPGRHGFGDGLYVQVRGAGNRSWLFRYAFKGKSREMGLGAVDDVTLDQARSEIKIWRQSLKGGQDPIEERRRLKAEPAIERDRSQTFKTVAQRYIKGHEEEWGNAKHRKQWQSTLQTYVYPIFGNTPISEISTGAILQALEPIWKRKRETASRVRGRVEAIIDYSTHKGWRTGSNPARWRLLNKTLEKRKPAKKKFPALPYEEIPLFMEELREVRGTSARALEFVILTAARSGMVRLACWGEFDLDERKWVCPGDHMKGGECFEIPLSAAAVQFLRGRRPACPKDKELVFPGARKGRPLSDVALTMVIRRMSKKAGENSARRYIDPKYRRVAVPHGFRSTFRDWCGDETDYSREVAEAALAHEYGTQVEKSYRRRSAYRKRATLMEHWALYCTTGTLPPPTVELSNADEKCGRSPADRNATLIGELVIKLLAPSGSGVVTYRNIESFFNGLVNDVTAPGKEAAATVYSHRNQNQNLIEQFVGLLTAHVTPAPAAVPANTSRVRGPD